MPYVKLDCGILDSTTWFDKDVRDVFITALLMAVPTEIQAPIEELKLDELETTGWSIPPGWYGFVHAASLGIVRRCGIPQDRGMEALKRLAAPERESRSQEFDGRRMVRVDGGFVILNYIRYREKDHTAAERQRRYRERQKEKQKERNAVTSRFVTQAEAEAEAEVIPVDTKTRNSTSVAPRKRAPDDFTVSDKMYAWAAEKTSLPRPTIDYETEKFCDHTFASSRRDWPATWRNWMRRADEAHQRRAATNGRRETFEETHTKVRRRAGLE